MLNMPARALTVHIETYFLQILLVQSTLGRVHTGLSCLKVGNRPAQTVDEIEPAETEKTDDPDPEEVLRCAKCQHPITRKTDRVEINEKHHHVFANPHGYIYQIGCFARAPGCFPFGEESSYFSWFPGYTWQVALCGRCLILLGWAFRSSDDYFFGLILNKLA